MSVKEVLAFHFGVEDMVGDEGRKQIEKDILVKKALEFAADNAKEIKK